MLRQAEPCMTDLVRKDVKELGKLAITEVLPHLKQGKPDEWFPPPRR